MKPFNASKSPVILEEAGAVRALAALVQITRLKIFRILVTAGKDGLPAGMLASTLDIAPSALSFHLKELAHAGLIEARQDGRFVILQRLLRRDECIAALFDRELLPRLWQQLQMLSILEKNIIMRRFHIHIAVADLTTNISFYSHLFGKPPTVEKPDYAK